MTRAPGKQRRHAAARAHVLRLMGDAPLSPRVVASFDSGEDVVVAVRVLIHVAADNIADELVRVDTRGAEQPEESRP